MKRGQTSIELFFTLGTLLLLFFFLLLFSYDRQTQLSLFTKKLDTRSTCAKINAFLTSSYITGGTFQTKISYNASLYNLTKTISIKQTTCTVSLSSFSTTNLTSGQITFEKKGGAVFVHN